MAHLEHAPVLPHWWILPCALHFAAAGDLRGLQPSRAARRPTSCPDVCDRCCCGRISLAWLGGRAWSLARRAGGSPLPGHSLLPAVALRFAGVLCGLVLFMAGARVATSSGVRARGDFPSSDHLLGNCFDLLPRGVGKALAPRAFLDSSPPDSGHCRSRPVALFQCATRVP